MRKPCAKVFAAFFPAGAESLTGMEKLYGEALGEDPPWASLEGDLLRLSWEGVYFPLEEALDVLARTLPGEAEGKLDYIDLDSWALTRHILLPGPGAERFSQSTRSLNHVLDYSGH